MLGKNFRSLSPRCHLPGFAADGSLRMTSEQYESQADFHRGKQLSRPRFELTVELARPWVRCVQLSVHLPRSFRVSSIVAVCGFMLDSLIPPVSAVHSSKACST